MNQRGKLVMMEPELEAMAGEMDADERLFLAVKMQRWVHQLRVSARVLRGGKWRRRSIGRIPNSARVGN